MKGELTKARGGFLSLSEGAPAGEPKEYSVVLLVPGLVLRADGADSDWLIPAGVVEASASLFEGVPCYLDHPEGGLFSAGVPQVRNLVGVIREVGFDPAAALSDGTPGAALTGRLRIYEAAGGGGTLVRSLLDIMLEEKEQGLEVPPVGLSAVFYHRASFDEESGRTVTAEFLKVESVDIVYEPGAGGYVRQALSRVQREQRGGESMNVSTGEAQAPRAESAVESEGVTAEALTAIGQRLAAVEDTMEGLAGEAGDDSVPATGQEQQTTLEDLQAQVQQLTRVVAEGERTVQGMGEAPAERSELPALYRLTSPLDEMQAAWDWIFGVEGAKRPVAELQRTDALYRLLSGDQAWTGVFNERQALAAANATTLAGMVVNAMNKVIVPMYDRLSVYRWYEQVVTVQPTDGTLHDMAWLQFGGIGDLPVVADGAAYSELSVDDSKETSAFTKYGGYVGITEKVLRNSEVAKIQAIPRALTVAAIQTRSAKIAALFTQDSGQGPTLSQDSKQLFKSDNAHGNYATTAFSWAAWKAARIECAKHAELASSKRTGFFPKFCLVPVDLYDVALQAFGYGQGPGGQPGTANNDVNPFGVGRPGDPRPAPVCVPDWTDATDWAYLVDPLLAPVIQMAYADSPSGRGHPPPQLYTVTSKLAGLMFTNDVLPIKVRDYFAYGVATYRGIGKRVVA